MTIDAINVTEIQKKIDTKMGLSKLSIPGLKSEAINKVLGSEQFDDYLQDQIYRWVLKAYLVNVKLQDEVSEEQFESFVDQVKTFEGREQLVASIIFASVPMANELNQLEYMSVEPEENTTTHLSAVSH